MRKSGNGENSMKLCVKKLFIVLLLVSCFCTTYAQSGGRTTVTNIDPWVTFDFQHGIGGSLRSNLNEKILDDYLSWLEGFYVSDIITVSDFDEWKDVERLCLSLYRDTGVILQLQYKNGEIKESPNSENGFFTDRDIFLGPSTNGLHFFYTASSNNIYTLFSPNGLQHKIEFTRVSNKVDYCLRNKIKYNPRRQTEALRNVWWAKLRTLKIETLQKLHGLYASEDIMDGHAADGVTRYYLKVNQFDEHKDISKQLKVIFLKEKSDGLYYTDEIGPEPYFFHHNTSFLGAYAVSGNTISFVHEPPYYIHLPSYCFAQYYLQKMSLQEAIRSLEVCASSMEEFQSYLEIWRKSTKVTFTRADYSSISNKKLHIVYGTNVGTNVWLENFLRSQLLR